MRRYLLLAVLIASRLAVSQTYVIPTGPFCGDCVITNMTFYDVSQIDAWRIDLSADLVYARSWVSDVRTRNESALVSIEVLFEEYDDLLQTYDHWLGIWENEVDVPFSRRNLEILQNYAMTTFATLNQQAAYIEGLDGELEQLDNYLTDDIPAYRATFATMCDSASSSGTNVCCLCPDYTPYFVKLTNDVQWIRGYCSNIDYNLQYLYRLVFNVDEWMQYSTGWPLDDVMESLILSRMVQQNMGYPEILEAFEYNVNGNPLFTYAISTSTVFSNLVASIRHSSDDSTMPFADSWSSFQSDITPSGLSTNLLWDRLTLPLFDLDAFLHWHLGQDQTYKDYKTIYGPSEAYWSLPNATIGVMSNFWESVHDRSEGRMAPSLVTYHNLLTLTNTVAQLEKMPVLDRITLLLWRIAQGGDDDNTNSPPDSLSSEIEDHDDADDIRAIAWDTEDNATASAQVSGILSGLRTLKSAISGTPDSTVRISGFSFPTIFGFTSPGFTTTSVRLADEGPLTTIYPIVRRVFILAWTLCMCWVVYRVAVFYLLLFGRVVAVLWPMLHGDMVKTAEAVHKVFDLTIFKAARFASFMGDFIEADASQRSWYGQDL